MVSPFIYLINRFFYRIISFFRHWYIGGFSVIAHQTIGLMERLDRFFAFRVTARYFLKPLYQDYSFIGYVLGFIFRSGRLLIGGLLYIVISLLGLVIYIGWAAIPIYIVYYGFIQK